MIGSGFKNHVHRLPTLYRDRMMAGLKMLKLLVFINISVYLALVNCADEILVGCGGFVKSDVELDYSLVEVRLVFSFILRDSYS